MNTTIRLAATVAAYRAALAEDRRLNEERSRISKSITMPANLRDAEAVRLYCDAVAEAVRVSGFPVDAHREAMAQRRSLGAEVVKVARKLDTRLRDYSDDTVLETVLKVA